MSHSDGPDVGDGDDCVLPPPPLPADQLGRYSVERDSDAERYIAEYVESQARDEVVLHAERVKTAFVVGIEHVVWDVTTDKDRYWVITELTNLYSQRLFPSLDYTLSFHVGLMMRMRSRPEGADATEPSPFDEVFRRQEQAKDRLDRSVEAEDFQAVGMVLRECLLSLIVATRRRVTIAQSTELPKDADFIAWSNLLFDSLCPGSSNKELRQHLKSTSKEAWQLVGWLTHARGANVTAATIAVNSCDTVVGNTVHLVQRQRTESTDECPLCKSRRVQNYFDMAIEPDGDYYLKCDSCGWTSHPDTTGERGA